MKTFERFIRYLCMTAVAFAVFYAIFPDLANKAFTSYGAIFGPIIVVVLFGIVLVQKFREKKAGK